MYLFTRSVQAASGKAFEAAAFAVEAATVAAKAGGLPVAAWMSIYSTDTGGFTWSLASSSMAELHAGTTKSMADAAYQKIVARAEGLFVAPPTDLLLEILHGEPASDGPPAFVTTVAANIAPGHLAEGYAAGVAIGQKYSAVTGQPMMFVRNVTGSYSGVGWIAGATSAEDMDETRAKMMANTEFAVLLDKVNGLFSPGTQTRMAQRIN